MFWAENIYVVDSGFRVLGRLNPRYDNKMFHLDLAEINSEFVRSELGRKIIEKDLQLCVDVPENFEEIHSLAKEWGTDWGWVKFLIKENNPTSGASEREITVFTINSKIEIVFAYALNTKLDVFIIPSLHVKYDESVNFEGEYLGERPPEPIKPIKIGNYNDFLGKTTLTKMSLSRIPDSPATFLSVPGNNNYYDFEHVVDDYFNDLRP